MSDYGRKLALQLANKYGLNPQIYSNQIQQESGFRGDAVSSAGARGPGQIMPATWNDPGYGLNFKGDINNYEDNMEASAQYMRTLLDENGGDYERALAAYNWGQGNVQKWNGDRSKLPGETAGYLNNILGGPAGGDMGYTQRLAGHMAFGATLADDAMAGDPQQQSNSPATLMEEEEGKKGVTFHGGMALSSLGAALSASAMGESAADQLGDVRNRYFAEQEAEYEKEQAKRQRLAAIEMVGGVDTPYGRALAEGADPAQVMAQYQMEQGFEHDINMSDRGFGQQQALQAQGHLYGLDTLGMQQDFSSEEARTARDFEAGQNAIDRKDRAAEQATQREQWEAKFAQDAAVIFADTRNTAATGASARELIASQYEQANDPQFAAKVRAMPESAFADPSMVGQWMDATEASGEDDVEKALRFSREYLNMKAAGNEEGAAAFLQFSGKGGGVTVNTGDMGDGIPGVGKLPPGEGYIRDAEGNYVIDEATGLPTVAPLPGTAAAREQAAATTAAQRATQAANDNVQIRGNDVKRGIRLSRDLIGITSTSYLSPLSIIPGTKANRLKEQLSPVLSNIGFDRLSQMRAESPTGGALGSVTEGELKLLQSTITALGTNLDADELRSNLDYLEQRYDAMIAKVVNSGAPQNEIDEVLTELGAPTGLTPDNLDVHQKASQYDMDEESGQFIFDRNTPEEDIDLLVPPGGTFMRNGKIYRRTE